MTIDIRAITPEDGDVIAEMHAESWRASYRGILRDAYLDGDIVTERRTVWRGRFERPRPGQLGFIATRAGAPVGFAFAVPGADAQWGTLLDNLHVRPTERGSGVGSRLLHALAERLLAHYPGDGLFLWVFDQNTRARSFYERLGATPIELTEAHMPDGGVVPEWRYAWRDVTTLRDRSQGDKPKSS